MKLYRDKFMEMFIPEPMSGCWIWLGHLGPYGLFRMDGRLAIGAHRASWILHNGEIPKDKIVCHRCDNPACVNPSHLFIGTAAENVADRHQKGRSRSLFESGERHRNSKLSDSDVREIKRLLACGRPQKEIAFAFGVSASNISQINRGFSRRNL